MPSINNQALLLDLEVFLANNNIRRGIMSLAVNAAANPPNEFMEAGLSIPPSTSKNFTCGLNNVCTVVRTTKPVIATMLKGNYPFTFTIKSLWVFTDTFDSIEFANASVVDTATVRVIQI
jgi:hypothetical protein